MRTSVSEAKKAKSNKPKAGKSPTKMKSAKSSEKIIEQTFKEWTREELKGLVTAELLMIACPDMKAYLNEVYGEIFDSDGGERDFPKASEQLKAIETILKEIAFISGEEKVSEASSDVTVIYDYGKASEGDSE